MSLASICTKNLVFLAKIESTIEYSFFSFYYISKKLIKIICQIVIHIAILINLFCDRSVGVYKKIGWRMIERFLIFLLIFPIYIFLNFPALSQDKRTTGISKFFLSDFTLFIYITKVIGNNKDDHWPFIDRPIEMSFLDKSDNFLSETKTKEFFFKERNK